MPVHPNQHDSPTPNATERHALRTHLTAVKGYAQLAHRRALQTKDAPSSLITYLERALGEIEQLVLLLAEADTPEPPTVGEESDAPT